jgi:hypothetical protein
MAASSAKCSQPPITSKALAATTAYHMKNISLAAATAFSAEGAHLKNISLAAVTALAFSAEGGHFARLAMRGYGSTRRTFPGRGWPVAVDRRRAAKAKRVRAARRA